MPCRGLGTPLWQWSGGASCGHLAVSGGAELSAGDPVWCNGQHQPRDRGVVAGLHYWRPPLRSPSSGENPMQSVNLILPPALYPGSPGPALKGALLWFLHSVPCCMTRQWGVIILPRLQRRQCRFWSTGEDTNSLSLRRSVALKMLEHLARRRAGTFCQERLEERGGTDFVMAVSGAS